MTGWSKEQLDAIERSFVYEDLANKYERLAKNTTVRLKQKRYLAKVLYYRKKSYAAEKVEYWKMKNRNKKKGR